MDLKKLQDIVISALEDIKGQDIRVFDAQPLTGMFDRVVIVSGTSNRQTRALAKHLHDKVKQAGAGVYGTEGEESGEWVLMDLGDIIVHIMQPTIREYYRLEEIWGRHPIDWQAARKKAVPRRKATAKKPITGNVKTKTSAQQPSVKKSGSGKSPVKAASKPAAPKPAAKKPASKKPAAKKPTAKPAKKKVSARKPAK